MLNKFLLAQMKRGRVGTVFGRCRREYVCTIDGGDVMTNQVYALILAAGVTAGTTLWDTIINLITDPPSVVYDGEWVTGCNRVVRHFFGESIRG